MSGFLRLYLFTAWHEVYLSQEVGILFSYWSERGCQRAWQDRLSEGKEGQVMERASMTEGQEGQIAGGPRRTDCQRERRDR